MRSGNRVITKEIVIVTIRTIITTTIIATTVVTVIPNIMVRRICCSFYS